MSQTPNPRTSQGWLSAAMVRAGDRIQIVQMGSPGQNFAPVWRTVVKVVLHQPDEDHVTIQVDDLGMPPLTYTSDRSVQVRRPALTS